MIPNLPKPVAGYLAAEQARDATATALCFTENGLVHDEGQDRRGRDAIRQWKAEANEKYRYTLEPLSAHTSGAITTLRARIAGEFPGSPVDLDHIFTLDNDLIASLEIHG